MRQSLLLIFVLLTVSGAGADRVSAVLGCVKSLKSIATGLEMWSSDHGGAYPATLKELVPRYLKSIPKCPAAGRDTYSSTWRVAGNEGFYMHCSGSHHLDFGLKANEPGYDARRGLGPASIVARVNALQDKKDGRKPIARCMDNLKNMATALEMWSSDHGGRYPETLKGLTPNYLRLIPQCQGKNTYVYKVSVQPDAFTIRCKGSNHVKDGSRPNYPYYYSNEGLKRE